MVRHPALYIAPSPVGGRGVFTATDLSPGECVEICPTIIIPKEELPLIEKTVLYNYYFQWGENFADGAIALGFGSLYNHSHEPNAKYELDFDQCTIDFVIIKPISAGEEIFISYNGDENNKGQVWFEKM